jgi:hypothetical protein
VTLEVARVRFLVEDLTLPRDFTFVEGFISDACNILILRSVLRRRNCNDSHVRLGSHSMARSLSRKVAG